MWRWFLRWILVMAMLAVTPLRAATPLVNLDSEWRFLRGLSEASSPDVTAWRQIDFVDASWELLPAPFWYGEYDGIDPVPGTNLPDMRNTYTSAFLRQTFLIDNVAEVASLELGAQSDDGFIAWINGREVARFNMPDGDVAFYGLSLAALSEPIPFQTFTLDNPGDYLEPGVNVLAVQGFNASIGNSSDFVINVSLSASTDTEPPALKLVVPAAGATLRDLTTIEVAFSEPVSGVDAADLQINGQGATGLTGFSTSQYVFTFPQPAAGTVNVRWRDNHGIADLAATPHAFAGGSWTYRLDPTLPPPGVMISEFMADNKDTKNDEDGDASDWIELHNATTSPVDITGWHLTDVTNNLAKWTFPATTLPSGGYLLVWASEKNRRNSGAPLHTNFKLSKSSGGYLALTDRASQIISEFRFYPAQQTDVSYGRDPQAPATVGFFPQPTPGSENTVGGPGYFSSPVVFSRPGGTFITAFALTLQTASPGAVIRYTLDGTPPSQTSPAYIAPIQVTNSVLVRARTFETGLLPGEPSSEGFIMLAANVLNAASDLPLVIIHNFGKGAVPATVDQPAYVAIFEPTAAGRSSLTNAPEIASRAGVNIRGASTQDYVKKSFALEWWNEADADKAVETLGMPAESDWVLYAPNNFEPILIHNAYAHKLSRQIGRYSSRTRFVEVYVNTAGGAVYAGNYNGIYVVEEKIKRDKDRVDFDRLEPEHQTPPKLTGGYLAKLDHYADWNERIFYAAGQPIIYQDPPGPEMETPQRAAQAQYINNFFNAFYDSLYAANWRDPVSGYRAYIDTAAAIDHHLLNVLTFNVDALRLSGYFYKPRNGKLTFGPVWDFDRALFSTDGRDSFPRVWRATVSDMGTDFFNYPWWDRMFQDPDFWQSYVDRYQELRQSWFANTNLLGLVDELTGQVRRAQPREQTKWGSYAPPRNGYGGEISSLKTWLANRVNFMDTNFLDRPTLSAPGGPIASDFQVTLTPAAKAGSWVVYTTDGTDPRLSGGAIRPGAASNQSPATVTITANARIVARALNPAHANLTGPNKPPISTPWSGAVTATYVVQTPPLVISELMFHPAPPPAGNTNDADAFEYVELRNTGSSSLELRGFHLAGGIEFSFTNSYALAPSERVVLVSDLAAFQSRYGLGRPVIGAYAGHLANYGDHLVLLGPLEEPIQDFRYRDDWYPITDGAGFSLVAVNEKAAPAAWSTAAQWRPSGQAGGSPGAADPSPPVFPNVVINEALTHTDPPNVDTVELINAGAATASIGGWWITDDFSAPFKLRIPTGRTLGSGEFLTFTEEDFTNATVPFRFSSLGDEVFLFSADANTNLTGYVHGFKFGAAQNGVAFGRHLDSLGREHFVAQKANSLRAPNTGPRLGPVVINEIMFDPAAAYLTNNNTRDEFIELLNGAGAPADLFDPLAPTNTWHLGGAIEFSLPMGITLQPGERLLIVGFDPALRPVDDTAFRLVFDLDASVKLFGPFRGNLNNSGDHVKLLKPDPPQTLPGPDFGFVPYVLVDEVNYLATAPWPSDANATGKSLQRLEQPVFGDDPASWLAAAATPARTNVKPPVIDTDGDGLPDDWETAHNLRPDSAVGEDGADGDPDADGATNLQEFLSGTDPRNDGSYLRVEGLQYAESGARVTFYAAPGLSYSILYRAAADAGAWQKLADVAPLTVGGEVSVDDPAALNETQRFYRLVTPQAP